MEINEFGFKPNVILSEIDVLSTELRERRSSRKLSIADISKRIGIRRAYLEAIESGSYGLLPAGVYGRKFVEEYASFLGVDKDLIKAALLEKNTTDKNGMDFFGKRVISAFNFFSWPKIIKNLLVFLLVLVCFSYLGWYLKRVFSPPWLRVVEPVDNFVTKNDFLNISGYAEKESEVRINGETVLYDSSGFFTKKVGLKNGINTVRISASNKYGRSKNIDRQILVNK